jgi:hypothetical protein
MAKYADDTTQPKIKKKYKLHFILTKQAYGSRV